MYNIVVLNSKGERNELDTYIYPDDNVSLVTKKISTSLNIPPGHIYIWIERKVNKLNKAVSLIHFLKNIFKDESLIHISVLQSACKNHFQKDIITIFENDIVYNMISFDIAYSLLTKINIKTIIQPLTHYYLDGENYVYLPYNPFSKIDDKSLYGTHMYNQYQLSHLTFVSAIGDEDVHTINVLTLEEYMKLQTDPVKIHFYFPRLNMKNNIKNIEKLCNYLQIHDIEFSKKVPSEEVSTIEHINILHFKTNPTYLRKIPVNLSLLFDSFEVSPDVPFMKYKYTTNIYHKVYKNYLPYLSEKWYNIQNFKLQDYTYIAFKVLYSNNVFISIIVNDLLSFDIRYTFHLKDEQTKEDISKSIPLVNKVIEYIKNLYSISTIPILPDKIENVINTFIIHRCVTYYVATLHRHALKSNAESFVKTKMFSYFDVIPCNIPNTLRLQYKKVDDFSSSKNIHFFIRKHENVMKRDEIIEKLQESFSLTKEDALNEYEKMELQKDSGDVDYMDNFKYDNFVDIQIRFNSPVDVRYMIKEAKTLETSQRISNLISHILLYSSGKSKETKKDIEVKTIFEEEDIKLDNKSIIDDDDDDWLNELYELEKEVKKENDINSKTISNKDSNSKNVNIDELDEKSKWKGFLKRMLDNADKDLFTYQSQSGKRGYASVCAAVDKRQPVVITEDEKKIIDDKYPGAYTGFVKSGSTKELFDKHYYICPKIWCPRSRVAIPVSLYKEKGKNACPKGEEPMIFEAKSFWGIGDKALNREHYPGFLDKYTREDGLCLPCCFKVSPQEGNRNKQRQKLCVPKFSKNDEEDIDDTEQGTTKYIKMDTYFPLENGRYGLLPKELDTFLGKTNKGRLPGGTGLMTDNTDCYLRKGVSHGSQSFIHCMISCLDNPYIKSEKNHEVSYMRFIKACKTYINILTFISLENGKMLKLFIDPTKSIFNEKDFLYFKKWFLSKSGYILKFNLNEIATVIENLTSFSKDVPFYKDIIREFIICYSYQNFLNYLDNNNIEKDHRILLDLCNISTRWLNVHEYNFVVVDVDNNGRVYIDCNVNRDTKKFINKKTPFVIILKHNKYYEPLYHVKTSTNDVVHDNNKFYLNDPIHSRIRDMLLYYYNNCTYTNEISLKINIDVFLESNGLKPKFYIIDYDFRLIGTMLINNLYIPFENKEYIFDVRGLQFIYTSDIVRYICDDKKENITKIYKLLEDEYGEFYKIDKYVSHDGILNALILKSNVFIPLHLRKGMQYYVDYLDDIYIFTHENEDDSRTTFMKDIISKQNVIKEAIQYFEKSVDNETLMEIMFLKDSRNPIPLEYKRSKMIKLLKQYINNIDETVLINISNILMNSFYDSHKSNINKFISGPNEVIFDYNDINENRLSDIIERAQNPFRLFHRKLNEIFDSYIFSESIDDLSKDDITKYLITTETKFNPVPVKYGEVYYKKILKDFNVLENNGNIISVYKLFTYVSKTLMSKSMTENMIKAIIKTNIVNDYKTERLTSLFDNPTFVYHLKTMKIKKPILDDILEIINSVYYHPSFYEIYLLARVININVVIIGRQTLKNPNGLFEVIHSQSRYYLILLYSYDRFKNIDTFECIVKNKVDIILTKSQLPEEVIKMINERMTGETMLPATNSKVK